MLYSDETRYDILNGVKYNPTPAFSQSSSETMLRDLAPSQQAGQRARTSQSAVTMLGRLLYPDRDDAAGPLFIEVYLYHPTVALEHDKAAMVPMVASPLVLVRRLPAAGGGYNRLTAVVFGITCAVCHRHRRDRHGDPCRHAYGHAARAWRPTRMSGSGSRRSWCRCPSPPPVASG